MSAIYGRKVINKTAAGYECDGRVYKTLIEATEAIDNPISRFFKRKRKLG